MGLRLHNTLTRTKEDFVPIDPANVRMYVCGPTVYDFAHIGNARPLIVFDVLYRLLQHLYPGEGGALDGSRVTYVRNITDVDDKINARAAEDYPDLPLNEAIHKVTTRTTEQFHADVAALGCLPPTVEPRATEFISRDDTSTDMVRLIGELIERGHAYAAEGHVLFDVASMQDYGRLSNRSLDDMIAGARVEVAPYKKNPMDFVLWKPSKADEPAWDSPWGKGRPGWHLECSAMAGALLGDTFDIHGGGIDLVFPHHENEIAQSRCAHGTEVMARYWMHNGFLQVEGEKMSKSAGNFVTIRELLDKQPGDVVRLQMLMTHYRQPIDWTERATAEATQKLNDWFDASLRSKPRDRRATPDHELSDVLEDDLNIPEAITYLDGLSKSAKKNSEDSLRFANNVIFLGIFRDHQSEVVPLIKAAGTLAGLDGDFGMLSDINQAEWLRRDKYDLENIARVASERGLFANLSGSEKWSRAGAVRDVEKINAGIADRAAARADKNWAEADRIRDELDAMGIALKDAKDPETGELVTTWEVKR